METLAERLAEATTSMADCRAVLAATALLQRWPHLSMDERKRLVVLWYLRFVLAPERIVRARSLRNWLSYPAQRFIRHFRFYKSDIQHVFNLLCIEETFVTSEGHHVNGMDAFLMLLRRFTSKSRLVDLEDEFGRGSSTISTVVTELVDSLFQRFSRVLYGINCCWTQERLQVYAGAIKDRLIELGGEWPDNLDFLIAGFLDGFFKYTQRPGDDYPEQDLQRSAYSGYYHAHGIRGHHVLFPDGMIGHVARRMIAGRQNDATLFYESGYDSLITRISHITNIRLQSLMNRRLAPHRLMTDCGYPRHACIFKRGSIPANAAEQQLINFVSRLRIPVEWSFSVVYHNFPGVREFKQQRMQPIGKIWSVAVLLTNCLNCLYGGNCSDYFLLPPPDIDEYLDLTE